MGLTARQMKGLKVAGIAGIATAGIGYGATRLLKGSMKKGKRGTFGIRRGKSSVAKLKGQVMRLKLRREKIKAQKALFKEQLKL